MLNIFNTIIEMTLKASVVILLILIVRLFIRNVPKKFSYMLWAVAAFRLCVPYSFQAIFSIFRVGGNESIGEQISKAVEQTPSYVPTTPIVDTPIINNAVNTTINTPIYTPPVTTPAITTPSINAPAVDVSSSAPEFDISQTGEEIVNAVADKSIDWGVMLMQIALVLWIIGFLAMAIYGIVTYIKTHKRMQSRILYKDNIYFSDKIDTPFSMGLLKPKIYLPFGLTEEEQECIIAHEKCHIKRFDHIVKLFSYLLLCIHWFNPMCWIAFNRMTYDMETSCDEMVFASGISEEKKKKYSHTLVSVGTKKRFPTPAPINFDGISNTKSRIKNILRLKKTKLWIKIICYMLCAFVLFACAADVSKNISDESEVSSEESLEQSSEQIETNDESNENLEANDQNNVIEQSSLISDALSDKIKIIDENGNAVLFNEYCFTLGAICQKQAVFDMDNDGSKEVIFELEDGIGFIILREYNNNVYAYHRVYRGLLNLKTDGTYLMTSSASDVDIARRSFDGNNVVEYIIASSRYYIDTEMTICTINGENVSEEEFNEFYDNWKKKEDVVFTAVNNSITTKPPENTIPVYIEKLDFDAFDNGEYDVYVEPEYANWGEVILFAANEKVTDFKFIAFDVDDDFNPIIGETLYSQPELSPTGKPLYIVTCIDTMSLRGIQYTDKNGKTRTFRIWYDHIGRYDVSHYLGEITESSNNNVSNKVMFEVDIATNDMCQNNEKNIYFIDSYSNFEHNYNIYIKPNVKMTDFKFIELDESEVLRVGKTLYEIDEFSDKTFVVSTYINDVTFNRGFSFIDDEGHTRYYAFQVDMRGTDEIPITFIEITDTIASYN